MGERPEALPPAPPVPSNREEFAAKIDAFANEHETEQQHERLEKTGALLRAHRERLANYDQYLRIKSPENRALMVAMMLREPGAQEEALKLMDIWQDAPGPLPAEAITLLVTNAKERAGQFGRESSDPATGRDRLHDEGARLLHYVRIAEILRDARQVPEDTEALRALLDNLKERIEDLDIRWLRNIETLSAQRDREHLEVTKIADQLDELNPAQQAAILDILSPSSRERPNIVRKNPEEEISHERENYRVAMGKLLDIPGGARALQLLEKYSEALEWEGRTQMRIEDNRTNLRILRNVRPRLAALRSRIDGQAQQQPRKAT